MSLLRIGDLARLGGVSVRMLRHYHEIGLLEPSFVDDVTGHRHYEAEQTSVLRRIVALKSLGLTLTQVDEIVNRARTTAEFRDLLLARRRAVVAEIATGRVMLDAIDREVEALDNPTPIPKGDKIMSDISVEVKAVGSNLVAQVQAVATSWHPTDIGPVVQPLYGDLISRLTNAGVEPKGMTRAWYDDTEDGQVQVHATMELDATTAEQLRSGSARPDFDVVELPAVALAATTLHHGPMSNCDVTYEALLQWIEKNDYRTLGYGREVDLECGPNGPVVTEIQIPIEPTEP